MPLPFEISDNPIGLAVVENDNEIKLILGRLDHSSSLEETLRVAALIRTTIDTQVFNAIKIACSEDLSERAAYTMLYMNYCKQVKERECEEEGFTCVKERDSSSSDRAM